MKAVFKNLALMSAFYFAAHSQAKDIQKREAEESLASARVICQKLNYNSSECMKIVTDSKYIDPGLMKLCMAQSYDSLGCLKKGVNKIYTPDEIEACKAKAYGFQDCVKAMGVTAQVAADPRETPDSTAELTRDEIKWQVGVARKLLEEGKYGAARKTLSDLENRLNK